MGRFHKHEQLAGRVILAGFDGLCLPREIERLLSNDALGGLILFKRNVESPPQVRALNEAAYAALFGSNASERRLIVAVDQEGGRVVRIREPLTVLPPARHFGEKDFPSWTRKAGLLVGRELSALGFSMNFAPVLDVDTNPASPVIGDRSYGRTPRQVIRHGIAFAEGLKEGGVTPCAKHFPGHGDAAQDSHLSLPSVPHDRLRLDTIEMQPFYAWAKERLGPVMTAHVMYPALDAKTPATLSASILKGELRNRIGFSGPVLTDDLEMGALLEFGGPGGAAVRAVRAGADGLLICHRLENIEAAVAALAEEASEDLSFHHRLEEAAANLATLRKPLAPDRSYIGSPDHRTLVNDVEAYNHTPPG